MIEVMFGRQLRATPWILAIWIIFLSFTAGLFEEFGRYVGYRWMMNRDPKTWKIGVLYGLGHGGIESIILVGVNNLAAFGLLLFLPVIQRIFPQEITGALNQQVALLTGIPSWMPLLASWERFWTIPVHVALSVIVLQVFIRRGIKWLWMAIGFHTIVNLFVVGLVTILPISAEKNPILVSIPVAIVGLLAVWIIWRFRVSEIKVI